MKHIIPLVRDIEFNNNIASIESISLEDNYKIEDNEVVGEFVVFGDYKIHNDTTEKELFKEKIPFNIMIPDNMIYDTVMFDIDDFTYEIKDNSVLKVCIDVSLVGDERESLVRDKDDARDVEDIWGLNNEINNNYLEEDILNDIDNNVNVVNNVNVDNSITNNIVNNEVYNETNNEINNEVNDIGEYIIYHIHIINEGDNIDNIISKYNTNIDILKEYNDISKLNVGDKLVIPDIYYGTN